MKHFAPLLFILFGYLWAEVEVSTNAYPVPVKGNHVLSGFITFVVRGDDFANASPDQPVYIRIRLDHNVRLSETLVDLNSADPVLGLPVYLPLSLQSGPSAESLPRLSALPESIAIVDWRAGHQDLWLAVQHPTSSWLGEADHLHAPSPEFIVSFTLGLDASHQVSLDPSLKNLPFNTRNPNLSSTVTDLAESVNTFLCVDLAGSSLQASDKLDFLPQAFLAREGVFPPDVPSEVSFTGSFFNAVLKQNNCSIEVEPVLPVTLSDPLSEDGWFSHSQSLSFHGRCIANQNGLDYKSLLPGTVLEFNLLQSDYGFETNPIVFQGLPAEVILLEPFSLRDRTLYRKVQLTWIEESELPENFSIDLHWLQNQSTEMTDLLLSWKFNIFLGSPPYCNQGFFTLGKGSLHLLQPEQPGQTQIVPHLTRRDGGFVTNLIFTNSSFQTEPVHLTAYDAMGTTTTSLSFDIPPQQTMNYQADLLLGEGDHAWLSIPLHGSNPVTAVYRANRANSTPAQVGSTTLAATQYRIFPGNGSTTWDGLALVNGGAGNAQVTIEQKDLQGNVLSSDLLSLSPREKSLFILPIDPGNGDQQVYFDLKSTQPVYLTALRGDLNSIYLWSVPAISFAK